MEYVDGKDLGAVVKSKGPLSVEFAVNYIRQAAMGLQYAMLKSLVHRDIKPANLMLTRAGSVKVADFGLTNCVGWLASLALRNARRASRRRESMVVAPERNRDLHHRLASDGSL